jgi:hypothetical protein
MFITEKLLPALVTKKISKINKCGRIYLDALLENIRPALEEDGPLSP